jgi:hypothetical protein
VRISKVWARVSLDTSTHYIRKGNFFFSFFVFLRKNIKIRTFLAKNDQKYEKWEKAPFWWFLRNLSKSWKCSILLIFMKVRLYKGGRALPPYTPLLSNFP